MKQLYLYERPIEFTRIAESVGPGWEELLRTLFEDLFLLGWDGNIHQVKEKFGSLRVYIGYGSDEIFDRIDEAEEESYTICEECGAPGELREGGWFKTLCNLHNERRYNND